MNSWKIHPKNLIISTAVDTMGAIDCTMRVRDQNGISRQYNMLDIYHSGLEPLIC